MQKLSLQEWGLTAIELRPYQIEGVSWFIDCISNGHGGILADEMGLGKTVQSISAILAFKNLFGFKKFMIMSPLTVLQNWQDELTKFAPNLSFIIYIGSQQKRKEIRDSARWQTDNFLLLTTYEYVIHDNDYMRSIPFDALIMDEGHRIKNKDSLLYKLMLEMDIKNKFLLTGTPIQNNINEFYNILVMIAPKSPILISRSHFKQHIESILSQQKTCDDQSDASVINDDPHLKQVILRRTKVEVLKHLPEKMEVVIFHGLTDLQKKLYKSFLMHDSQSLHDLVSNNLNSNSTTQKLMNILMQIRKCVLHPYLFPGIEKEPFQLGEHLVDNSMKLFVLDRLLSYLLKFGHKVLVFSQMTKMLDIIQDYCFLRGFDYERLDGSVRSEERFAAVANFNKNDSTKLFLLSTRAGGQGLNLTAADTVVFVDSDFNPQVDLQAMARIHRPGQIRPCRTVRLIGKHTVEEMIISRAQQKLIMTRGILGNEEDKDNSKMKVKDMICYGLNKLFSDDCDDNIPVLSDEFFTSILGATNSNSYWENPEINKADDSEIVNNINHMYLFEGTDYKISANAKDIQKVEDLLNDINVNGDDEKRTNLKKSTPSMAKERKMESQKQMWKENGYTSRKIESVNEDDADITADNYSCDDEFTLKYVFGDVTQPIGADNCPKIICHVVDNSGMWGIGGMFSSIDNINQSVSLQYLASKEMEDLKLGDCHLLPLTDNSEIALLIAQSRDGNDRVSAIKLNHLDKCLRDLAAHAIKHKASVHMPRIGYKTPQFNWYGVERLINKCLVQKGVDTSIYYYRRGQKRSLQDSSDSPASTSSKTSKTTDEHHTMSVFDRNLSEDYFKSVLTDIVIYFDTSVDHAVKNDLIRHIFALNGDVVNNPFDGKLTHYVVSSRETSLDKLSAGHNVKFVTVDWLMRCVNLQAKISEEYFTI